MVMKKIAIFVDVQNIYYTTRDTYGRQFNYRKLWQKLSTEGEIVSATAYDIARNDDSQIKFQDALKHIGFEVMLIPLCYFLAMVTLIFYYKRLKQTMQ